MLGVLVSLLALQSAESAEPPHHKTPTVRAVGCRCSDQTEPGAIIIEGVVVDAEVTLAPGGLSVNDRMATIFDVKGQGEISGRTRVWHQSNPDQCGVTFDYGLTYKVALRQTEDGALETDACLMRKTRPASQED